MIKELLKNIGLSLGILKAPPFEELQLKFTTQLHRTMYKDDEPHPADRLLDTLLVYYPSKAETWLLKEFDANWGNAFFTTNLLLALSSQPVSNIDPWGFHIASCALKHTHMQVRVAAIMALEHWEDVRSIDTLEGHTDKLDYMNSYARSVLRALRSALEL